MNIQMFTLVATAEFLMNYRTHRICLSYTDSDNVIRETETIHVSDFQFYSTRNPLDLDFLLNF